jgi:hypothetical protein
MGICTSLSLFLKDMVPSLVYMIYKQEMNGIGHAEFTNLLSGDECLIAVVVQICMLCLYDVYPTIFNISIGHLLC